jgi:two-component sensor histidine kinase
MPLSGPFAFVFPAVVIATLYGHWTGGLAALIVSIAAIQYLVLPFSVPLSFMATSPSARIMTAVITAGVLLLLAETFRANAARHAAERDSEIERREMLLRELEHRTRNNFALVASLLEFQRRQSKSPEVVKALDHAISRVHTFADAYTQLDSTTAETNDVDMKSYLLRLLDRVADALFGEQVRIESDIEGMTLPSRKAVAVGLYVNEALTNCAKYAFPGGSGGTIKVALGLENGGWRLTVLDDGVGDAHAEAEQEDGRRKGLGGVLFDALAAQAGARHEVTLPEKGRRLDLVSVG